MGDSAYGSVRQTMSTPSARLNIKRYPIVLHPRDSNVAARKDLLHSCRATRARLAREWLETSANHEIASASAWHVRCNHGDGHRQEEFVSIRNWVALCVFTSLTTAGVGAQS